MIALALDKLLKGALYSKSGSYSELKESWYDERRIPSEESISAQIKLIELRNETISIRTKPIESLLEDWESFRVKYPYITAVLANPFASLLSFLEEGDDGEALAVFRYLDTPLSYDKQQAGEFELVKNDIADKVEKIIGNNEEVLDRKKQRTAKGARKRTEGEQS